ncbi:MAG: right-handed parallel beta-helix repeat-containing protein [Candidatus Latescibacteria bacterium]|jgi:hypothetical protein|nr:right-handed parallel beta-helix repeat-containing protein [Candidatus Latescibacterota bacterium]
MNSYKASFWSFFLITFIIIAFTNFCFAETPGNIKSPQTVKEVQEGKRTVANAAWWGFDEKDATAALQSAINSGAKRVIVPNMTKDWIVKPIKLASNQELMFEEGVVVTAKRGEFRGKGDNLFSAEELKNITIRGYGATWRMQKKDYLIGTMSPDFGRWAGPYEKSEWRHAFAMWSCENIEILGLTIKDSGGDGIYLGATFKSSQPYNKNIHIKDVVCDNHHRQGISVISVDGLLLENSVFMNTWGTLPCAGIDFEPNAQGEKLTDIIVRNCVFKDNYGNGIVVAPGNITDKNEVISIRFENCRVTSKMGSGIIIWGVKHDGPDGVIEFRDCVVENTEKFGLKIADKPANKVRTRFVNCTWRNVAHSPEMYDNLYPAIPMWIYLKRPEITKNQGGIDFIDCIIEDSKDRPFLVVRERESDIGVYDITGNITVRNPYGAVMDLGAKSYNVTLKVIEER